MKSDDFIQQHTKKKTTKQQFLGNDSLSFLETRHFVHTCLHCTQKIRNELEIKQQTFTIAIILLEIRIYKNTFADHVVTYSKKNIKRL